MKIYFVIVGITLLGIGAFLFVRRLYALICGVSTVGHIHGHEMRGMDGTVSYNPIVVFTDSKGRLHQFTSVAGRGRKMPEVGAKVRVCYLPGNPKTAFIQTFLHMWAAPLGFIVLGLGALAVLR